MFYTKLKYDRFFRNDPVARRRVVDRLRALRRWLVTPEDQGGGGVPHKDTTKTLLLATWNIRDFGKDKGYGERKTEALFYIAETIAAFDLIALQEVSEDMRHFHTVMDILGPDWGYIATDVTGNQERMVFVYDTRKVRFRSIVGEITLLENDLIRMRQSVELPDDAVLRRKDGTLVALPDDVTLELPEGDRTLSGKQFNRTPFMVSFQAGWFKFNLCTVHMYFGSGKDGIKRRTQEIAKVAKVFKKRAAKERKTARERGWDEDSLETYFVLGDFNILKPGRDGESATLNALLDNGFGMHPKLREKPTNMFQTEYYDQIAVLENHGVVRMSETKAGVLNLFDVVYRASADDVAERRPKRGEEFPASDTSDFDAYFDQMGESEMRDTHERARTFVSGKVAKGDPRTRDQQREWYATAWRTYHISDHLPMWMALEIDFADAYFDKVLADD